MLTRVEDKPYYNVLLTHSSFAPPRKQEDVQHKYGTGSALLFPSFKYIPALNLKRASLYKFIEAFILPEKLHPLQEGARQNQYTVHTRRPKLQENLPHYSIDQVIILICGHGGRDERCGVMGPVLRAQFLDVLQQRGLLKDIEQGSNLDRLGNDFDNLTKSSSPLKPLPQAQVALISHIGGHRYAGNVIIYIPPTFQLPNGSPHPLAGRGIWYGLVEPRHVEGIVEETFLNGRVIEMMFRGGLGSDGPLLRI